MGRCSAIAIAHHNRGDEGAAPHPPPGMRRAWTPIDRGGAAAAGQPAGGRVRAPRLNTEGLNIPPRHGRGRGAVDVRPSWGENAPTGRSEPGGSRWRGRPMGLITWLIFGAIAGWLASLINKTNAAQGWIGNIVLGIVGAIVGGFVYRLIVGDGFTLRFNVGSLLVAILGALLVSYLWSLLTRRRGV